MKFYIIISETIFLHPSQTDNTGLDFSAGFSICLRLSYKFLAKGYIFHAEQVKLFMRHYKAKLGGVLNINDIYIMLPWPGISLQIQEAPCAMLGVPIFIILMIMLTTVLNCSFMF